MDIRTTIIEHTLILAPKGRLDGHGSGLLQDALAAGMTDTIRFVLFDLTDVPYLSSAGLRVMVMARKQVAPRDGKVFLSNVSPFIMNVLQMAGMYKIFQTEPDTRTVLSIIHDVCAEKQHDPDTVQYTIDGGSIEILTVCTEKATLHLTGSLLRVLYAQISPDKVRLVRFSDCEYSIGLGAMAESPEKARELLGEMITLQGSIVWLPTDGNKTPDFFIPITDTGEVRIYTGFNAALRGHFQETLTLTSDTPDGISLSQVYKRIFDHAREMRPDYSGIIAIALIGESGGIRSSGITHPPVRERAPMNGGSIMDPGNVNEWIEVSDSFEYAGESIIAFGIGIDLTHDLSEFQPEQLSALSYIHPANRGLSEISLHTHGVVFKKSLLSPEPDIGSKIRHLMNNGEFLDMRHLMDDSRLRTIHGAIAYISEIETDE